MEIDQSLIYLKQTALSSFLKVSTSRRNIASLILLFTILSFVVTPSLTSASTIWNPFVDPLVPCGGKNTDGSEQPACNFAMLIVLAGHLLSALIYAGVLLSAAGFMVAGYKYLLSGGSQEAVKQGRMIFRGITIGIIITLCGWLLISMLVNALINPLLDKPVSEGGINLMENME